ncbi:hypothetical protein BKA70DRAFT_1472247 [Coprinopsis sp. MPI-PUGE-AT-0042]|nr:hypothetical protein BKA70DRAFT_1472247 [Coprinopsis sp. MPI-PUGE-AT-0042]
MNGLPLHRKRKASTGPEDVRNTPGSILHFSNPVTFLDQGWNHASGTFVNIERAGNVFSGTNYGSLTMISNDESILAQLPTHPDISGHLSDYFPSSRDNDEKYIMDWINNNSSPELVLCALGRAGVRKTTFAKHLAEALRRLHQLAAEIFFGFADANWGVESIIKLIARQLAAAHPLTAGLISRAVRVHSGPSVPLDVQVEEFLVGPIRSLQLRSPPSCRYGCA